MKVNVKTDGILIGVKAKDYTTQSGGKGTSYSLALEHCDEVGNLKCTKDVFDAISAGQFPKYGKIAICGVYDSDYKNLVIDSIRLLERK